MSTGFGAFLGRCCAGSDAPLTKPFASKPVNNTHPIDLALVALVGIAEAVWWLFRTVLVPAIVIALVIVGYSPTSEESVALPEEAKISCVSPKQKNPVSDSDLAELPKTRRIGRVFDHPLNAIAEELSELTNRELMTMVGTRKKLTKSQLVAALVAC